MSQISRMTLENGSFGINRFVVFWYRLISIKALVPGLYFRLIGVPAPPGLFPFPFATPTCFPFLGLPASGVEVEGLMSFLANFFTIFTFGDFDWRGGLGPVDFLAVGCDFAGDILAVVFNLAGDFLGDSLVLFRLWSFFFFILSAKLSSNVV